MFDTRQIEYIFTIAEEGSLTRAADRLYISQSALSQQLSKLQKQGIPSLFEYKNGKMNTTDAGKIYLNGARTIMHLKEECEKKLAALEADNNSK